MEVPGEAAVARAQGHQLHRSRPRGEHQLKGRPRLRRYLPRYQFAISTVPGGTNREVASGPRMELFSKRGFDGPPMSESRNKEGCEADAYPRRPRRGWGKVEGGRRSYWEVVWGGVPGRRVRVQNRVRVRT
eukprot:3941823-Rhodomonas_salina.4